MEHQSGQTGQCADCNNGFLKRAVVLKPFVNLEVFCGLEVVMAFTEKFRDTLEAFDFSIGKLAINLQPLQKREVILPSWVIRVAHLHRYAQFVAAMDID